MENVAHHIHVRLGQRVVPAVVPPGGASSTQTEGIGVLFADLRGFTFESELRTPVETKHGAAALLCPR